MTAQSTENASPMHGIQPAGSTGRTSTAITQQINGTDRTVLSAAEGYTLRRLHDGFLMGPVVILGIDYSTGAAREDKPEYYEEIKQPEKPEEHETEN